MEIIKITPQGLCKGVIKAINIINRTLDDPTVPQPIYMLGNLVHNDNIIRAFEEKGIIILEGKSRIELLDEINNGTVIFTAHGVADQVVKKAMHKGLHIVDATCHDVKRTHDLIKQTLQEGKVVFYYGKKNHPETEGTLLISKDIILIEDGFDINSLPIISKKAILTNQTTMSYHDVIKLYNKLIQKYPQLELVDEICNATRFRQEAVIKMARYSDLCLIVGDKKSNNTQKLLETAEKFTQARCIKIEGVEDLNDINLDLYQSISITAGASTPKAIVEEIIDTLQKYPVTKKPFKTKLKGSDFLKFR